jgi:hypothetical protein
MKAEKFAAQLGWEENDAEVSALIDVVRRNQDAGHASWFHGANPDAVVGMLMDARQKGVSLS